MPGSFIPPNGLAGFAQQTPAVQSLYKRGRNGGGSRRRRKKKAAAVKGQRRRRTKGALGVARSRRKSGKRLQKGSAAAKARMAQLRKMRKR